MKPSEIDDGLASIEAELTPSGVGVLKVLRTHMGKNKPLTRGKIAEAVGIPEGTVLRLLRDVRLCVARVGLSLDTIRGEGYSLRKR